MNTREAGNNRPEWQTGDPTEGTRIGPYEVMQSVARGGMATVFAARDTRDNASVAIKLLLPIVQSDEARSRFRREFRALSRIQHENVLRVFEWGLWGDRPWFSMELVSGHDLRREAESLPMLAPELRFARVRQLLLQVCRALMAIHERGLVHRDVTPGNIMVSPDGRVRLMDFGVVKELGAELTAVGEVIGTVAYMAPEQITSQQVDTRADLYSLGAVLYLLLTGKRPFSAHTLHGFMEKHLHQAPKPPREVDPLVPRDLDEICLRLLEKQPSRRYASASHLLQVLGGQVDDEVEAEDWPPRTVGRTLLKAQVRDAVAQLALHAKGGALLLTGPAGQGKTRLLDLGMHMARRRGLAVARGRCRPDDRPFGAFIGVYDKLERTGAPAVLQQVLGGKEQPGVVERYPVISAFKDLLVRNAPLVVILDDLERADPATVEMLQYLIRNTLELANERVLFLLGHEDPGALAVGPGTAQAAEPRGFPPLHAHESVRVATLGPLDESEVEELVVSVLDNTPASLALAARLHHESSGSPAFIADMLRGLRDDGLIVPRTAAGSRMMLTVDASEITRSKLPMPASLRQALAERLQPLSAQARAIARLLALSRRKIEVSLLVQLANRPAAGGLAESDAIDALDELLDAQIAIEDRDSDEERVELSHNRLRDVLLEELAPDTRRTLHRLLGEVIELFHRDRLGLVVDELAWHFEQAGVAPKAYAYLVRTAQRNLQRSLYEESLPLFERALALEADARHYLVLDEADLRLAELYLARAQALVHLGQLDRALGAAQQAESLANLVRDARLQARVSVEIGTLLRSQGQTAAAEPYLRRGLQRAQDAGDETLQPLALYHLGGVMWGRGQLDEAERMWRDCLEIAQRIGDERARAWGLNGLGILAICRGKSLDARRHLEESAVGFERLGMLAPLAIARVNLVELYLATGVLRKALALADQTIATATEVHHLHGVALGLAWRAQVLLSLGRWEDAVRNAGESLRLVRELKNPEDEVIALGVTIKAQFATHQFDAADQSLAALLPLLHDHDAEGLAPQVTAWHARALAWRGQLDAARAVLDTAPRPEGQWPHMQVRTDIAWGRTQAVLGDRPRALASLEAALQGAEANGFRYYQLLAHHELARICDDPARRVRHERVAQALARSLAANLSPDDGRSFLERGWGNGS